jgi:hypothetical protein
VEQAREDSVLVVVEPEDIVRARLENLLVVAEVQKQALAQL